MKLKLLVFTHQALLKKSGKQADVLIYHAGQGYSGKLVPRLLGRGTNVQQARHHHVDVALPRRYQHCAHLGP